MTRKRTGIANSKKMLAKSMKAELFDDVVNALADLDYLLKKYNPPTGLDPFLFGIFLSEEASL